MGKPLPDMMASQKMPDCRLNSWKEIAAYLNRDVTTAQGWEKREAMPIHRHVHDKRGSVYALVPELDAWLHRRRLPLGEDLEAKDQEQKPESPVEGEGGHRPGATLRHRGWLALAGIGSSPRLSLLTSCPEATQETQGNLESGR